MSTYQPALELQLRCVRPRAWMGNCACVPQDAKTVSNGAHGHANSGSGAGNSHAKLAAADETPHGFDVRRPVSVLQDSMLKAYVQPCFEMKPRYY